MTRLLLSLLAAAPSLLTTAEQTNFERTGRYDEVMRLCGEFPRRFPGKVRCDAYGTTPEGRPMLAFAASADGVLDAASAKKKNRPVVFWQGGIHAGEIDGKDAGFLLLRELLEGKTLPGALGKVTVLFVPVFNVDGHERFGPNNRPNQRGPKEMGWRVDAVNLNLNRDYAKAEAPEMGPMLKLLHAWEPVIHMDLHVTDGSKFQHDVSITFEPRRVGPPKLRALGTALHDAVMPKLTAQGHLPLDFYPALVDENDPASGFAFGVADPRFGATYWALNNRFGMLVETHSWKDYATRVRTTYDVLVAVLEQAMKDGGAWLAAAREADVADKSAGGSEVVVDWAPDKSSSAPFAFQGYAYTREMSDVSGQPWVRYDESKPQVWNVPLSTAVKPTATATVPKVGYLVTAAWAPLVQKKLELHGFSFEVLKTAREAVPLLAYRGREVKFGATPYEGRQQITSIGGAWAPETRALPAGSLFVPTAQPHVALLVHLLDPAGPDSLLRWGFFNQCFEQREYMEDYVAEEVARAELSNPRTREEFDARMKDPAFAKSPAQRLRFFYERHPSFDERLNLYPVFRLEQPL